MAIHKVAIGIDQYNIFMVGVAKHSRNNCKHQFVQHLVCAFTDTEVLLVMVLKPGITKPKIQYLMQAFNLRKFSDKHTIGHKIISI